MGSVSLFYVSCESRELGGRGSSRFPCVSPVVETSSGGAINFDVGELQVHGIGSCRLVYKGVVEALSNYKKSNFW